MSQKHFGLLEEVKNRAGWKTLYPETNQENTGKGWIICFLRIYRIAKGSSSRLQHILVFGDVTKCIQLIVTETSQQEDNPDKKKWGLLNSPI